MRHLVLALMIVLLPLRGWVGDVMATEMASSVAVHLQTAPQALDDHAQQSQVAQAVPDCAGHATAQDSPEGDTHCATCTVCQACHTVALLPEPAHSAAVLSPPALPYSPAAAFASAHVALGQKPPIS